MKALGIATSFFAVALVAAPATRALAQYDQRTTTTTTYQWDTVPQGYSDVARRGWHDGMEAARMDWQARRWMDPYHSPMFRNPPVPGPARPEYRNAYLRGYDAASHHQRGWGYHDQNGWHDEHENWRENHENWDNEPTWNQNR